MEFVRKTIREMVRESSRRYPKENALIHREKKISLSYGELEAAVERAARGLIALGIGKGDRVAVWAPNIPEWLIAFVGIASIGAIVVPVDPGVNSDDLGYILGQSEARAVVMAPGEGSDRLKMLAGVRGDLPLLNTVITVVGNFPDALSWDDMLGRADGVAEELFLSVVAAVEPRDAVAIMYTSGTTGRPKGVVLDHLGLVNKSIFSNERLRLLHSDRACLFFPLFHMFGNTCIALSCLIQGATLVMPSAAFEPTKIIEAIREEGCTAVYGSPSMLIALLEHPDFRREDWSEVKKGIMGGAPCPAELMKRLVDDVGVAGITVAYGITETSSWLTMTNPDDPLELRVKTIGTALACNEIMITDPGTGEELPPNVQGELCTRGFLMKGYHGMPAATANAIDRNGWYHTGDLGRIDERGYVYITGRLKDVVRRNGQDIYPLEIEDILYRHPEIAEAQVFGFSDHKKGQELAAWVRIKEGAALSEEGVSRYLAKNLPPDKLPGNIKIVRSFPMTRSGKVQKFKLAEMVKNDGTC